MSTYYLCRKFRHLPTGVLFDLLAGQRDDTGWVAGSRSDRHDMSGEKGLRSRSVLPWRITVHFQGCPQRQVTLFGCTREIFISYNFLRYTGTVVASSVYVCLFVCVRALVSFVLLAGMNVQNMTHVPTRFFLVQCCRNDISHSSPAMLEKLCRFVWVGAIMRVRML